MEKPKTLSMDEERKETIQKIKDFLDSLIDKRFRKRKKKIEEDTIKSLDDTLDDSQLDSGGNGGNGDESNGRNLDESDGGGTSDGNLDEPDGGGTTNGNKKNKRTQDENTKKSDFDVPPEDQDEYIPQDSEIGESLGEESRFAEIYPPFLGYYTKGKKSYFNRDTNLWSKKAQRKPFNHVLPEGIKRYTYTGVITEGINAIPLPEGAWPDTTTLHSSKSTPEFQVDQNGCVYLISKEKQFVSFNFGLNQHTNNNTPVIEDSERIIFDSLSSNTQELLNKLSKCGWPVQQIAAAIKYYIIKNKKYSTKVQGTLRNKSNRNNYIKHLDESPILECFSANSLFVALCRQLGIPARLVVGHMVQSSNGEGKACLTKNDGHAWSEVWDDSIGERVRFDATPTEKEDGDKSNENGQEQNENRNNDEDADNNFDDQNQITGNDGKKDGKGQKGDKGEKDGEKESESSSDSESDADGEKGEDGKKDGKGQKGDKGEKDGEKEGESSSDSESDADGEKGEEGKKDGKGQKGDKGEKDGKKESESSSDSESDADSDGEPDSKKNQSLSNGKGKLRKPSSDCPEKTPGELLDEMMEKAKEDSLLKQAEQLKDTLDKLEQAGSKEELKDILDKSGLTDFAKDMVDKIGQDKILEEEKKEMEGLDDESKIDEALQNSLLNEEYKQKLKDYARIMKKKIEEEKKRMKSEMERLGFKENELGYYKEYKELEAEVEQEVRRQIRELERILPKQYHITKDEEQIYRSGPMIEGGKLAEFVVTGDPLIFKRNKEVRESNEISMFETIIIDTSGSMGSFSTPGSILRESIKAAIIRAKVLEHFKVDFSIVLFGDRVEEVMSFGEKFSSKGKCSIPARLIRAAHVSGGNSREPISYVYQNMLQQFRKHRGKSFGNISFIGDGDLYCGHQDASLKAMIDDLKKRGFGVTAYYINNTWSNLIAYYFGTPQDGGAVYAGSSKELSKDIVEAHKTHLKKKIRKYIK